jgi:DNA-binding transcriptional LysR family regulator
VGRVVENLIANAPERAFLKRVFVSHMAAVLKAMTSEGRGTAWLPESHLAQDLASGALVRAGDARWEAPIDVRVIRARESLPEACEGVWSVLAGPEDTGWG